ncbi:unnamed protein product [Miscanthus lutarioriparius]|uniref:Uncharacterized protein n=1 Tax=Miscanthus lutarioriparius TaxID=422564 RepID=A0A811RHE5_9POAL|nr:unnamed protein product [Miscanthus lutarioriparius]
MMIQKYVKQRMSRGRENKRREERREEDRSGDEMEQAKLPTEPSEYDVAAADGFRLLFSTCSSPSPEPSEYDLFAWSWSSRAAAAADGFCSRSSPSPLSSKPPSIAGEVEVEGEALVSGMDNHPSEAAVHELSPIGRSVLNINQEVAAAAPPHFLTRSRSSGNYDLQAQRRLELFMADLEAGEQGVGARRTGGGAAAPVQEPSVVFKMLEGAMVQAYAASLPACVTAYPLLKDTPDHVKFTIFGGLAFITVGLFAGILSRSVARRGLAIRLVSCSAIAVLTFSVASQLAGHNGEVAAVTPVKALLITV